MAKQDTVKITGIVTEALSNAMFRVKLDNLLGAEIIAQISGKIRMHRIRIVSGDKVEVEMSTVDLTRGRISRRL